MLDARTIPSLVAAGLAALMLSLSAAEAFAVSASSPCTRWAASQLDPYDLNVMRSSVSASSRLAVAIRLRSMAEQCQAGLRKAPRHPG